MVKAPETRFGIMPNEYPHGSSDDPVTSENFSAEAVDFNPSPEDRVIFKDLIEKGKIDELKSLLREDFNVGEENIHDVIEELEDLVAPDQKAA